MHSYRAQFHHQTLSSAPCPLLRHHQSCVPSSCATPCRLHTAASRFIQSRTSASPQTAASRPCMCSPGPCPTSYHFRSGVYAPARARSLCRAGIARVWPLGRHRPPTPVSDTTHQPASASAGACTPTAPPPPAPRPFSGCRTPPSGRSAAAGCPLYAAPPPQRATE